MRSISQEQIIATLHSVGINMNDSVFIHSSLFTLGAIENHSVKEVPEAFLNSFKTAIGDNGNIFMPAFNYQFPRSRKEDLRSQECVLGYWPEWFRQQPNVVRSGHPMFSICGLGPDVEKICLPKKPEYYAFAENSTFSRLIEQDTVLVLQGIGLRVATVIVQIEAMLGLKYRFNKPFTGVTTLTNGEEANGTFYHFCFPINNAYREDYSKLEAALLNSGIMKQAQLGRSFIYTIKMKALYHFVKDFVADNQFALLNSTPSELYRFENGQEISYSVDK
ncbi:MULTISPECIES: AAC(3) family N-acetyltransferase [unclassified Pseudoalteromonas]|uniref:AAC(3) family N-acetyltransferase n=1 Tax=unclassified Pseudoalteromonas TaxID=194690 RepID=UPI000C08BE82|nr:MULTISPECIES: AAC(3) family N-acetyltransferase [unclassified Pseudoalteromonas]MDP2635431.1 AAC(3) family N-acetyltransferase [Pseudoalteromonas sp. 1_MG-2023]PHN88830.1 hypothetical protein CSC79_16045 [Pseudoalteromonas sp. 3D05]